MTLDTVSRYDSDRVATTEGRAVVLGGGMAGLLTARVLADAYTEVVLIDRDEFPTDPSPRRGVPQGHHVHVLLEAGRAIISDLFPGYGEDLIRSGALIINVGEELRHYEEGGIITTPASRMEMYCASRPLIEGVVRDRLRTHDGVEIRQHTQFADYVSDESAATIEGVTIRTDGEPETLEADLVVDATGRSSRTPTWLAEHGYEAPPVEEVTVDMTYSSIRLERDPADRTMYFAPPSAPREHGGAAFPIEGEEWLVTLGGMHGTDPPSEAERFADYAADIPIDGIERVIRENDLLSADVDTYPFPSNRRHRYEALDRFPENLLVVGDAIASFNPIYGQGMSSAALEAMQLHDLLAEERPPGGPTFFEAVEEVVDIAWSMAVGADIEFEATTGPEPRGATLFNRYFSRLIRQAHTDPHLAEELYTVIGMERGPTALLEPGTLWRTAKPAPNR